MSYRVRASQSVRANVRRMARDRLDDAVAALESAARGHDVHDNVHEARKRTKQVRALTRLVREAAPDLHTEVNAAVRDAARRISDLRDRTAVLETLTGLADAEPLDAVDRAVAEVQPVLVADRDAAAAEAGDDVEAALQGCLEVRDGVGDWDVPDEVEAITGGFALTYGRCVRRLADVKDDGTTGALHEWRKRVKYHRYHVRVLEPLWPALLSVREQLLHDLTDLLGDDHDLAVLRGVLASHDGVADEAARTLALVLDRRRAELQRAALPLGTRLFSLDEDAMAGQVATWWSTWLQEARRAPLPEPLDLAPAS